MERGSLVGKARWIFFVLTVLNIGMISGCWDYREINNLAIVAGAAIDREQDMYNITVEVLKPETGKEGTKITSEIFSGQGSTIFEAVRNTILKTGKKLYWSHAKVIIVGQDLARDGIMPVADWVSMLIETRPDLWMLISREKTAGEILEYNTKLEDVKSFYMEALFKTENEIPRFSNIELWQMLANLSAGGMSAIAPAVGIVEDKGIKQPEIYGCAVFKGDKMTGLLDGIETRNVIWIRGKGAEGGIISVSETIDSEHVDISLEVTKVKLEKKAVLIKGKPAVSLSLKYDMNLAEVNRSIDFTEEKQRSRLKDTVQEYLRSQILQIIRKVQNEFDSDIFGFGHTFMMETPELWKKLMPHWDSAFRSLDVEVEVEADIRNSALMSKPIKIGE